MFELFKIMGTIGINNSEADSALESTEGKAEKTSKSIGQRMQEGLGKAEKAIGTVGKGMTKWVTGPIVAASAGVFGLMTKTGDYADRVLDLSDITGMSTDAIQEWSYVADIAGVSGEAVTSAVTGLVRRLPQLESEGGKANDAMEKLGLSYDELSKLSPDEQVDALMYSLSEMEDPLERNAAGSALFGGAWQDLAPILGMGADEMAKTRDEAHELGTVMSNDALQDANAFRQEMERLKNEFMGVFRELSTKFVPIFQDHIAPLLREVVIPAFMDMADRIVSLIEWFNGLDGKLQHNILKWIGIAAAIGPILVILSKVIGTIKGVVAVMSVKIAIMGAVVLAIAALVAGIVWLYNNNEQARAVIDRAWTAIRNVITTVVQSVVSFVKNLWGAFSSWWSAHSDQIMQVATTAFKLILSVIRSVMGTLVPFIKGTWQIIQTVISSTMQIIGNIISLILGVIRGDWTQVWNSIKNIVTTIMNAVRSVISTVLSTIKSIFSSNLNSVMSTVSNIFTRIRETITRTINGARDAVRNAIEQMKGFFNFNWELPKIKLPRFSVSGSANPLNWLSDGVPKINVEWFAKGGILEGPTAFGMNGNSLMVGGEAGREAVLPLNKKTLGGIGAGIAKASGFNLESIQNMLWNILDELQSLGDRPVIVNVELDGRVIARVTRDPMDRELGKKERDKGQAKGRKR